MAIQERVNTLEQLVAEVAVQHAKTEKTVDRLGAFVQTLAQGLDRMERESRRDRRALNKKWGELANRMGTVVEEVVAPNIPTVASRYFGVRRFEFFGVRVRVSREGDPSTEREFDVVAWSPTHFILNETKTTPTIANAEAFVALLPRIPEYFPQAAGRVLVPLFSSFRIAEDITTYLTRHGVYCMVMRGDTMRLSNFDQVRAAGPAR